MAITVDWNGSETPITSSNAYAIYQDYVEGDIDDMSSAAINACKNYLSDDEVDEIEENYYNNGGAEEEGADSIDTDGTDDKSGVGAVGATVGNIAAIIPTMSLAIAAEGNGALIISLAALAVAAVQYGLVELFDVNFRDRKDKSENAGDTNGTLDNYADQLIESQESMNDDMDAYSEASEEYTLAVNENTSNSANLQAQLKACQAAGDTAGAESIQSQLDSLAEESEETTTDGMDEIQENMTEYQNMAAGANGAAGSGQSVADFLKVGYELEPWAYLNATGNLVCSALMYNAAAGIFPKLPFAVDGPAAISAKGVAVVAGTMFLTSAGIWGRKAIQEHKCGSTGSDMQGHVNTLNSEIENQSEYMDFTNETYGEVDEASAESQENANNAASEVLANNGITTTDDEETKKASGTAAATA